MDVVVLAGGLGTRLRGVIKDMPKPMAMVKDKPFLEHLLNWVTKYPINKIILATGYKSEIIESYFGDFFNGIPLEYSIEDTPLGTGGAIIKSLSVCSSQKVLIINGDSYFPIDINQMNEFFSSHNSKFTIALKRMFEFERYGSVTIDTESCDIIQFNEKKYCSEGLINAGIYLIDKEFLLKNSYPEKFSFETEVLEVESKLGNLKGQIFSVDFIDIGIPEDYKRAGDFIV
ncbi:MULTISPECIES: nucleotidyltransferase family protein [unclassified Arcicella]|uniref:nucleotidyltransferase family protein n=1 Tax=unclassified Arcicella TaxID=2644986 RepID=UPI0028626582|nr:MULTISPECIES: nucleotidyltransferase family protein [unclassified Arcicella]MDR6564794.1 D-glycero-alpha-D-manno-heptose 1-phosphate guanylyltransferase [Arcicella sp. BE51]MDR6814590.1 D-glycero-alpha-D-manno-heptose 1-phosphate guanylyltransferase [Arcicella sp. BE140]MDR6825968.1 D-glycero-alpha-D-manno-heptose 1-phosphate guanylyltransferase [Arcicella sp. BE139]